VFASRSGKETAEDNEAHDDGGFEQNNLRVLAFHAQQYIEKGMR
jgi:hypothetical protein